MTRLVNLEPALRANDRDQIMRHGHIAAIVKSPTPRTAVRRAAMVLGQHHHGMDRVEPVDVALALMTWHALAEARRERS